MRPRKMILVAGADEETRGIFRYALNVQIWSDAREASTMAQFRSMLAAPGIGQEWAAVVLFDTGDSSQTLRFAKLAFACCPVMILALTQYVPNEIPASVTLPKGANTAEIIDRLKTLTARKRGPKKGSKQAPQIVAEVA